MKSKKLKIVLIALVVIVVLAAIGYFAFDRFGDSESSESTVALESTETTVDRFTVTILAAENKIICNGQSQEVAEVSGQTGEKVAVSSEDAEVVDTDLVAGDDGKFIFSHSCDAPPSSGTASFVFKGDSSEQSVLTLFMADADGTVTEGEAPAEGDPPAEGEPAVEGEAPAEGAAPVEGEAPAE